MSSFATATLMAATISTGLGAGVFGLYAHTIMPALRGTDDRTFVAAFQAIDRAIVNPLFIGGVFLGALVATALAVIATLDDDALPWASAALALTTITVVVTFAVNVPRNNALKALPGPDEIPDLTRAREAFGETSWAAWNLVRVVASTAAFVCLAWALVEHGRATG